MALVGLYWTRIMLVVGIALILLTVFAQGALAECTARPDDLCLPPPIWPEPEELVRIK